jgi:hypothetical protein
MRKIEARARKAIIWLFDASQKWRQFLFLTAGPKRKKRNRGNFRNIPHASQNNIAETYYLRPNQIQKGFGACKTWKYPSS